MATGKDALVMWHPDLPGREIRAVDQAQARVFEKSGWKRGRSKSSVKAKTPKEKPNG
jgi:hypothetical protein